MAKKQQSKNPAYLYHLPTQPISTIPTSTYSSYSQKPSSPLQSGPMGCVLASGRHYASAREVDAVRDAGGHVGHFKCVE